MSQLELQASKESTISLTIPHVHQLLRSLENKNSEILRATNPYLAKGVKEAYDKLYEYYPTYESEYDGLTNLYIATVLDPRLKLMIFLTRGFSSELIERIKEHFLEVYYRYKKEHDKKKADTIKAAPTMLHAPSGTGSDNGIQTVSSGFFSDDEPSDNEQNEVMAYLSEKKETRSKRIFEFYERERTSYPVLYQMAKDFLATPAMPAPAEGLFSRMGDVVTKKRNRISSYLTRMVAFLKYRDVFDDSADTADIEEDSDEISEESQDEDSDEDLDESQDEISDKDSGKQPNVSEGMRIIW